MLLDYRYWVIPTGLLQLDLCNKNTENGRLQVQLVYYKSTIKMEMNNILYRDWTSLTVLRTLSTLMEMNFINCCTQTGLLKLDYVGLQFNFCNWTTKTKAPR